MELLKKRGLAGNSLNPPIILPMLNSKVKREDLGKEDSISQLQERTAQLEYTVELLKESENKYKTIFEGTTDGIFAADIETKEVVFTNVRVCKMTGYSYNEFLKLKISNLHPKKESQDVLKKFNTITKHKNVKKNNMNVLKRDGGILCCDVEWKFMRTQKRNLAIIFFKDITKQKISEKECFESNVGQQIIAQKLKGELEKRKEAEKKLSKFNEYLEIEVKKRNYDLESERNKISDLLRKKTEFINQLSHDIKTPLTPIITMAAVMELNLKERQNKTRLDIIQRNAKYLQSLVVNSLNLANLELGEVKMNLRDIKLRKMIEECEQLNEVLLLEKNVKIINNVDKMVIIQCDKLRMKEVFQNIISNSIRFMPKGGHITFKSRNTQHNVVISTSDTGRGITKKNLPKIFDEFYVADASRHGSGCGLGLSISRKIVKKHNGKIWAKSGGKGKGCSFFISLPKKSQPIQ